MKTAVSRFAIIILNLALSLMVISTSYAATRIRDLTSIQGVRDNDLIGYGLVVGLDGTGDQTTQTPFTIQSLTNMLSQLGVALPARTNMQLKNVAAVMVTAQLPPFAREGQKIDVVVSSLGNAQSLRGGTLLLTPLKGVDNQVYALAQGNILISGAGAHSEGSSIHINQLNGGRIIDGAIIEREVPTNFSHEKNINLQLDNADFTLAQNISDTINHHLGHNIATAIDGRTISLQMPTSSAERVRFLSRVQNIPIKMGPTDALVIINSRTGSIVMNQDVTLGSCLVAQGDLTVNIQKSLQVSQPNTPFGGGQTVVVPNSQISIQRGNGSLQKVDNSTNLNSVLQALNSLGATPNDLMAILQSMQNAGCLHARIEVE